MKGFNKADREKNESVKQKLSKRNALIIVLIIIAALIAFGAWFSGAVGGISKSEAKEIAMKEVSGAKDDEVIISDAEFDDMQKTYDVQVSHDNILYSFQILARNGEVTEVEMQTMAPDDDIDKAVSIAVDSLEGAKKNDVKSAQLEEYNGKVCYEVEIRLDGKDYEIIIDPETDEIVSQSSDSSND